MTNLGILAGLFSPGQIAGLVIICVIFAGTLGLIGYLVYLLRQRGAHKLETRNLQNQRDALLKKLEDMRAGRPFEFSTVVVSTAVADEPEESDEDDLEESIEDVLDEEGDAVADAATGIVVRYNRSFKARVIQADNDLKARYSELKNYLLAYDGVRPAISWKHELYRVGRKSVASIVIRGKTLCLCLASDPAMFADTKYKVDDISARNKTLPCLFRVKSDRKMSYAKELVDIVMAGFNAARRIDYVAQDFTVPYKSTEVLVKRRLVKILGGVAPDFEKEDALAAAKGFRYDRSFKARIIQSDDALKVRYTKLKNYLMAHEGVDCADSWRREIYRFNGSIFAAVTVRGKTLCLYLAADPARFTNTKYKVENYALRSKSTDTPLMYRIKNDRRLKYATQLIDLVCVGLGTAKIDIETVNYAVPFTATDTMIRRGLIRVVKVRKQTEAETEAAASKETAAKEGSEIERENN